MKNFLKYLLERGKEKSTIITAITVIAGGFGASLLPEQSEAIAGVVIAVLTAVGVFTKEKNA